MITTQLSTLGSHNPPLSEVTFLDLDVSLPWDMAAPTAHEASLYTTDSWEHGCPLMIEREG